MGGLKGCWFHTALSSLSKMFLQSEQGLSFMFSYVLGGGGEHYVNNIYFVKENSKRASCSLIVNAGGGFFFLNN